MEGVHITISTVFISALHSLDVFPRMQRVQPLYSEDRISQAPISNAMLSSCATRIPGRIPTFPGEPLMTE